MDFAKGLEYRGAPQPEYQMVLMGWWEKCSVWNKSLPPELLSGADWGSAVSVEAEGQSPEERAQRYLAKAEQARIMVSQTTDPTMQASLKKLASDWEYLATHVLRKRI